MGLGLSKHGPESISHDGDDYQNQVVLLPRQPPTKALTAYEPNDVFERARDTSGPLRVRPPVLLLA